MDIKVRQKQIKEYSIAPGLIYIRVDIFFFFDYKFDNFFSTGI